MNHEVRRSWRALGAPKKVGLWSGPEPYSTPGLLSPWKWRPSDRMLTSKGHIGLRAWRQFWTYLKHPRAMAKRPEAATSRVRPRRLPGWVWTTSYTARPSSHGPQRPMWKRPVYFIPMKRPQQRKPTQRSRRSGAPMVT
ncbi:MAG: hypothetical protein IPF99_00225 [Deltaproteobacteria bacterium]|nr:hypothetical protein [Deltaproteobacteria bacterium]